MSTIHPKLAYGEFYGSAATRQEIPGFSLACMRPELPPEQVPRHTHEDASLVLLLSGAYISTAVNAEPVATGSLLIYNPPGTTHRDRFQTLDGRFLAISVSPASVRHASDYAALPERAICFRAPDVVSAAQRLAMECARWECGSALVAEGMCLQLLGGIGKTPKQQMRVPPAWLIMAREVLHDQCTDSLRIVDVARIVGVHPVHLVRSFRQFFQCTPGEFARRCQLDRAASLLVTNDMPLAETALQCGFADQSHFSKAFRRSFGHPPGVYRRLFQRKAVQI